jgi:MFS family permease
MIDNRPGDHEGEPNNAPCTGSPGSPTHRGPTVPSRGATPQLDAQIQRRVIVVLAAAQAFTGIGVATAAAVGPVAAATMSGSTVIGGAAATAMVLGAAASSLLIARIAGRAGRRPALTLGYLLAAVGAVGAALGSAVGSWPLMLAAFVPFGAGSAAGFAARFAATDLAPAGRKARALGVVMWATTVGAVAGPVLAGPAAHVAHALRWPAASGSLVLGAVAFGLAAVVVGTWLRPDPLLLARTKVTEADRRGTAGPVVSRRVLWASPRARLAVSGIGLAQLVMVGLMSMTPVHMNHAGTPLTLVGLVISMHMAGMFALAPAFGWLADRVGPLRVLATGLVLLVVGGAGAAAASGHQASLLAIAMGAVGLGWSAALVAGSSLVTEAVALEQRTAVQGWVDVVMSLSGAAGGIVAGVTLTRSSYGVLAGAAAILVLLLLAGVFVPATVSRNGTDRSGKIVRKRRPPSGQDTAKPRRRRDGSTLRRPRMALGDAPAVAATCRTVGSCCAGCPAPLDVVTRRGTAWSPHRCRADR